jgi:chromosome transmission fidelity protein 18
MESLSSPKLPFTSDPALHEWEGEFNPAFLPSSTNSDDFEALHLVQQESLARKNKAGEVIQHRAWQLGDTFRSEADHHEGALVLEEYLPVDC